MTTRSHSIRAKGLLRAVLLSSTVSTAVLGQGADGAVERDSTTAATMVPPDSACVTANSPGTPMALEWIPFVAAGSDDENYLRYLQTAGLVPGYPWSSRGFSPREAERLSVKIGAHPWSGTFPFITRRRVLMPLPVEAGLRANSSFPYGGNDGAIWSGRGVTADVSAGFLFRAGPLSAVASPLVFQAQNAAFRLLDNNQPGRLRFADPLFHANVDRPQRFGDESYGRADQGQSTVQLDAGPIAAGISGANLVWGPLTEFPFLLGTNAPGFTHAFAGTAQPINLWIARLHGRVIWGRLEQSAYSPVSGSTTYLSEAEPGTRRFATGIVLVGMPRGVAGLELGIARFFHMLWPQSGIPRSYLRQAFSRVLKRDLADNPDFSDDQGGGDNQLVSLFARWAFPAARLELYGEYGREDHAYDWRDFVQEPDHSRTYGFGMRHVLAVNGQRLSGLRFELINYQAPALARSARSEGGIYAHTILRQGHTHRGQLLGANVAVGTGAGSLLAWDRYTARGRTTLGLRRTVRQERGTFYLDGVRDLRSSDVQYALEGERMRKLARMEVTGRFALVREFNRDFRGDAWNASTALRIRVPLGLRRTVR